MTKLIHITTDGACSGNPGVGGWAWINEKGKEHSGVSTQMTTCNRMELQAIIEAVKSHSSLYDIIKIYTDSLLTVRLAKEVYRRHSNLDLWEEYDTLINEVNVLLEWVPRNSTNDQKRVDKLAKLQSKGKLTNVGQS